MSIKKRLPLRVAVTGGKGTIGTVLQKGLTSYNITSLDRPKVDVREYHSLKKHFGGIDAVIHLAFHSGKNRLYDSENSLMAFNVYQAALDAKVRRVIMASSVHADDFYTWKGPGKLTTEEIPVPASPYGADKVFMESLGRYYAKRGLEVICVRFGRVTSANKPPEDDYWETAVWLSNEDCINMIEACLTAEKVPDNFAVFYAVSNNKNRVHDTANPFGWSPK